MFGYIPQGPFDLTEEDLEGVPIARSKSRAYKIAVWAGVWGAHQFFLGRAGLGYLHWVALLMFVALPSQLGFWPGLLAAVLLNAGTWFYAIYSMAQMAEDDPRLEGETSEKYSEQMLWYCKISLWGIDFWKPKVSDSL